MKQVLVIILTLVMMLSVLAGCNPSKFDDQTHNLETSQNKESSATSDETSQVDTPEADEDQQVTSSENSNSPDNNAEPLFKYDKYMITASSFLYVASLFCNDNILPGEYNEKPSIWITSEHFHKTFVKTKEYFLEFDTNADICYDACGLGRVHKRGAESAICLSVPFPSSNNSNYNLGKNKEQTAFSICPAIKKQDCWFLGAEDRVKYSLSLAKTDENCARVGFVCNFESEVVEFDCMVNDECVMLQAKGHGDVGIALPVFDFDGETHSQISAQDNKVCVKYGDWVCEYSADVICSMNMEVANRNGIYKCYMATGNKNVIVKIRIYPQ